jgi:hypothetical protein
MDKNVQQSVEGMATTVAYGASGTAVFLGLNVDEWGIVAAIAGILGVIATAAFNWWFKMKYQRNIK